MNKPLYEDSKGVTLKAFHGEEASCYFEKIAMMRITFFQAYPYLYQGSLEDEFEYLRFYFESKNAVILLVFDKDEVVGFSNGGVLSHQHAVIQQAFIEKSYDLDTCWYIGDVILAKPYRGNMALLKAMLSFYESYTKQRGYKRAVGITINREDNHPLKPKRYLSPQHMIERLGFSKWTDGHMTTRYVQVDTGVETENTMDIWERVLS